jgi:AcrR family transcriptional regulator
VGRALPLLSCDAPSPSSPATTPGTVVREERKDAARNRKKILDAAREVMQRRGLDSVCMDELAAAAGVGKGTLYRRFHDKFALFRALLDDDERVLQEAVRRRFDLPKSTPPQQRLMTLWNALVDFVVDHRDVLAAAEVEARSRAAIADSPPYHWRHIELVRELTGCGVDAERASLLADAWLQSLAADVVRRACLRASVEAVRAAWRAVPEGLPRRPLS